jgi:hypothetical protein
MNLLAVAAWTALLATQDARPELVDRWIRARWEREKVEPARSADDAEFLRRVTLDVVGRIPSLEEVRRFLADRNPNKRGALVDALLHDDGYAAHWAEVWSSLLVGFDNERTSEMARDREARDLRALFLKNTPYDEFARAILTVDGPVYVRVVLPPGQKMPEGLPAEVPLASYVVRLHLASGKDLPLAMAGKLTRVFMGVQIQCAQCHDHPFDRWTQEEFYGMASFFTGVLPRLEEADRAAARRGGVDVRYKVVYDRDDPKDASPGAARGSSRNPVGDLAMPDSASGPVKPAFLGTGKGVPTGRSRRDAFATHMTAPENLQFARMAVNRYWAQFFGAGIVDPVDDFNARNKPSHPELLDALAREFIAHRYDLHWLIRTLTGSEAYQRTSRGRERDPREDPTFARSRVRALSPEVILRSVLEAMGSQADRDKTVATLGREFRTRFDDDEAGEVARFAGTIPSALLMMNAPLPGSGLSQILARYRGDAERVQAIYLRVLSRMPSPAEESRWVSRVTGTGAKGFEDLFWTLLNTSEFLFNH